MECIPTEIPDVKVLVPKKFGDHRGFFFRGL
jgi:dTDP-4-dehydrorhamnose 3,5-epimerase-like enzyme